jgi:uncharacterized protein (DUF983 family)
MDATHPDRRCIGVLMTTELSATPDQPVAYSRPVITASQPVRMLVRGLTKRCARCGSGRLFRRWLTMVERCPGCGYRFEREEGFFLGAIVVNVIITEVAIIALIAVGFALTLPKAPVTALAIAGGVLAGITPLISYPFTKTVWTAADLIMRKTMGESYSTTDGSQPSHRTR